ncbi:UDP-N-acetylglucosamine 2-epimerase (non-hydrolyzing) [Bradyrhizobium sp. BR 10289]|uniref:non-hydrolyzing UDP-N-acetylglucosamine 2-epimerase n=1 Tax=Bradyrhizobium sp. BR 10289 TaxID=2749993 RepID=UPI001C6451FF|nr:UDP-N-acetylglucosamine 2-epimerase (non-hydrolyzing) [Bradyrhizobium sp. BR 10289]MBW7970293.1 UDP-N-acetylglucosamine 2-epimerase (non-hydrolyzing) [Bradyrhizobium sp. BR 10289]
MKKLKVVTVVGTRPEIIRLSRIIARLDEFCEHILVHTGQNYDYELNQVFFEDLGIRKPDRFLESAGAGPIQTISNVLIASDRIFEAEKPEAVLVLGDTNSCLGVIAAKRRRIPIFHMEAGNRCFDQRVPEEINRRIVDHTADVNLTYSDIAREYLLREGLPPDLIIKTGSPMLEVLEFYRERIESSDVLRRFKLTPDQYFVVSAHREENVDSHRQLQKFLDVLNALASDHGLPIIVSTHPRTKKRLADARAELSNLVRLEKPLGFTDYVKLQTSSRAVLSDSGTITEEASVLNFPALNLRETHERPEGMEEGAVMLVGLDIDRVRQGLAILTKQPRGSDRSLRLVSDYDVMNVSDKVVRIVHSYTDYVRRVIWREY